MMYYVIIMCFLIYIIWFPFQPHNVNVNDVSTKTNNYFVFALTRQCNERNISNPLTIHGLWPQYNQTYWPKYCNKTDVFDLYKIKSLIPELVRFWPSCYGALFLYTKTNTLAKKTFFLVFFR